MKQQPPRAPPSLRHQPWYRQLALVLLGVAVSVLVQWTSTQYNDQRQKSPSQHAWPCDTDLAAQRRGDTRIGMITMLFDSGTRFDDNSANPANASYQRAIHVASQYTHRWGYPMWIGRQPLLVSPSSNNRPAIKTWSKLALTLSVVLNELRKPESERLQWVYFIDADTVITNHNIPLETFVPPEDDGELSSLVMLISTDQWGTLNTGGYFIRVCQDAIWLLSATQALGGLHVHDPAFTLNEQESLTLTAVEPAFIDKIAVVPAEWFNADAFHLFARHGYFDIADVRPVYRLGDFMVHFMSDNKHGWQEMLDAVEVIPRNTTLHMPLEQTRLLRDTSLSPLPYWYHWLTWPREQRRQALRDAQQRVKRGDV